MESQNGRKIIENVSIEAAFSAPAWKNNIETTLHEKRKPAPRVSVLEKINDPPEPPFRVFLTLRNNKKPKKVEIAVSTKKTISFILITPLTGKSRKLSYARENLTLVPNIFG